MSIYGYYILFLISLNIQLFDARFISLYFFLHSSLATGKLKPFVNKTMKFELLADL